MFDWMLPKNHAISILRKDHDTVKELFEEFEEAESVGDAEKIIDRALTALKIHAVLEEEIFYPAVRAHVGSEVMNEADEEHHLAKILIAELDRGPDQDHRTAKFAVLAENVRHHIREEENEMLPKAKEMDIDFEALGQRMLDRKASLLKNGIPRDAEHAMVAKANGKSGNGATAKRKAATPRKAAKAATRKGSERKTGTHAMM